MASKTPTASNNPQNLEGVDKDKISKGDVTINKADGTSETLKDVPLYNGAFYDPDTGDIMGDTHGPEGIFPQENWNKTYERDENGVAHGTFDEKSPKKEESTPSKPSKPSTPSTPSASDDDDDDDDDEPPARVPDPPPLPPPPPPKVEWSEPFPTFSSDYKIIKRYIYHLGVDDAVFSNVLHEENTVCITPLVKIGTLGTEEYLMLEAEFEGNIEFYILDGDKTINILPISQTRIENEKLFYGLPTRFIVDDKYDVVIKRNGIIINENYTTILSDRNYWVDNVSYSITYTPIMQNTYKPTEEQIQLKMIMRGIGSISYMAFRYYGESYYII